MKVLFSLNLSEIFVFIKSIISAIGVGSKKKNPDLEVGGPNQKPLTIKPYPMKIHRQYR